MRSSSTILCLLILLFCSPRGGAAPVPDRLLSNELGTLPGETEAVKGMADGLLLTPFAQTQATDPRSGGRYAAAVHVYVSDNGLYARRFVVQAPDASGLPFARRVGRMLALIWAETNKRFGVTCAGLRRDVVQVWLTRGGEAGGEHFRNNLYLYDYAADRTGLEWAREVAHEYGHYLLPGASGYTEPENWGNGVLGERLFLKWLQDDLKAKRLEWSQVPFVSAEDLDLYRTRQVTPLIEWVERNGPDVSLLRQRTRRAMDAFTGLLLYADATYGPACIMDLLIYMPQNASAAAHGEDFLNALLLWADNAEALSVTTPAAGAKVYLPRGAYSVSNAGGAPPSGLTVLGAAVSRSVDGCTVRVPAPGWRAVSTGQATTTAWRKKGAS